MPVHRQALSVVRHYKTFHSMRLLIFCFVSLTILGSFTIGEPVAELTCKSKSGRTIFNAVLPQLTYHESAHFEVDGAKIDFEINDKSCVIFDKEAKVLTIYIRSKNDSRFVKFWAIPSTFKTVSAEKGTGTEFRDVYKFRGKIVASEPRQGKGNLTPETELECELEYSL